MYIPKDELKAIIKAILDTATRPYSVACYNRLRAAMLETLPGTMLEILQFNDSHPSAGTIAVRVIQYDMHEQLVDYSFSFYGETHD